jgi:hypothetical protein
LSDNDLTEVAKGQPLGHVLPRGTQDSTPDNFRQPVTHVTTG